MLEQVTLGVGGERVPMPGIEIKVTGVPSRTEDAVVPALGASTDSTLQRIGFTPDQVTQLRTSGAIR
jgi:crotonobetainyl-CoA:carnitine CoA-transferase CaiB-like acyl-CoA transferase